jgi:hypothetical protein
MEEKEFEYGFLKFAVRHAQSEDVRAEARKKLAELGSE